MNFSYKERLVKPASLDHVAGGMAAGDDKWIGISNFHEGEEFTNTYEQRGISRFCSNGIMG